MKFRVKHEIKGRIRVRMEQKTMSFRQADILQHYLEGQEGVTSVKVYERTGDAAICFVCGRSRIIDA